MSDTKQDALVPQRGGQALATTRWRMIPSSLGEAMEMAKLISDSELCPKTYRGRPFDCIVAYEYGSALGLSWMQALRSVSVINGQAALWGDAIPALIYSSGECERFHEYYEGTKGTDDYTGVCIMKRKGMPDEVKRTFSVADAKKANLWGKVGPWQTYPDRMLQMRPRGFCARDTFADKLSGLILAEEALDYPTVEGTVISSEVVEPPTMSLLDKLPEGLRDNVEKAFSTLNLAPGLRLAKVNEFMGGDGVDPETGAQAILDWCRDEFAKRKTGQPRKKKDEGNGKPKVSNEVTTTTLESGGAGSFEAALAQSARVVPNSETVPGGPPSAVITAPNLPTQEEPPPPTTPPPSEDLF